ncbi:helix-turn-helix transcriptional regulator [Tabrizicola sp.]|uniref:helix-turn-helix domain-containing protein n=1 Tax=Tabrizicola sp. TaxID=2005166 RepID=UPI001A38B893|nr:helix-turn-helix transcriptional regulator [Tabrizicola sp.]MBL9062750.1 helix-turn-helix transcriptional regulator [Tabrizicola sp.]
MKRYRRRPGPTGAELAAVRKAAGLSQTRLAQKAQIGRDAVSYWECKPTIDPRGWAVRKMAEAEPAIAALLRDWATNTRAREMGSTVGADLRGSAAIRTRAGMGLSPLSSMQERPGLFQAAGLSDYFGSNARARDGFNPSPLEREFQAILARELIRLQEREAERAARRRVRCDAKTTRKGTPCRNMSEPGRRRCKHHGGRSTGPRTLEGKARIAEAQKARWARWRSDKVEAENTVGIGEAVT